MKIIICILYLLFFIASGTVISCSFLEDTDTPEKIYLGSVFGLVMLCWFPALFSFILKEFCVASQYLSLFLALLLASASFFHKKPSFRSLTFCFDPYAIAAIIPVSILCIFLLSSHTIQEVDGALHVGQSTYGDLAMHLGFITSISEQKVFPPMYSICPDKPLCYPFLSDSISSTFYTLGASLRASAMLPAILALILVATGTYLFFKRWLKSEKRALLAHYFFFIGGGFGFAYFFDLAKSEPGKLPALWSSFYNTPTNYVDNGLRWVNPIADMLIPQRATLFGWAILIACLLLLYRAVFENNIRLFFPLGILAGSLPLIHTHSFLALGIASTAYLVPELLKHKKSPSDLYRIRMFLLYGLTACLLAFPQLVLFTFKQSGNFLRLHWNWGNVSDNFIWFYIKNWGFLFLLLPAALLTAEKEMRKVFIGPALIWMISECILFQPNTYDNNKLLFITFFFICGLIADYLCKLYIRLTKDAPSLSVIGTKLSLSVLIASMFISGSLTLIREAVSDYELVQENEVSAAEFIRSNTSSDSTFLACNNHNNAVAMLTGRNIVCGSGTFLYFHGIDYYDRENALPLLFSEPSVYFPIYKEKYSIDYIYIGSWERSKYDIDYEYFNSCFPLIYDKDGICIYSVNDSIS